MKVRSISFSHKSEIEAQSKREGEWSIVRWYPIPLGVRKRLVFFYFQIKREHPNGPRELTRELE